MRSCEVMMMLQSIAADATALAARLHPGAPILLGVLLIVGMVLWALLRRAVRLRNRRWRIS